MKKEMKKYCILISLVSLLFFVCCGIWGVSLLNARHTRELSQIGSLTGAVLTAYPEAEDILLSALQDTQYRHTDEGWAILQKYGYRRDLRMTDSPDYRTALARFLTGLTLFLFLSLALVGLCFFELSRRQRETEARLHALLDSWLSEDTSLSEITETFPVIFNASFTDTLLKLGNKLTAKTQTLNEERDRTKTLVTDISHQLKTPVSALKSCFSMCLESDSEEERTDFLQRCAMQMNRLENLLTALVNISRLETSLISLHPENTTLSELLTDAVNTVYEKALQKEISIEVRSADTEDSADLTLSVDRHWTAEAVANLLDNAVKYSPAGSRIFLNIRTFYSYVQLSVTDAGIGIPKEDYNRIFSRFYRGSHPVVRQSEGAGVGLYLARRIIEEQHGTVTVHAAEGEGSVFEVRLPLQNPV
ncbi:MAG: HAMP domain-containing histidine kinase [Bacteroidales bacterium]|nr:HAMP domain-containing histidine kinase [Bacteroidales bacterium]MCM1416137.1 HAMP domain-containing histidine kinase [bacterium]MCM1423052.1 HAMP domain-containing histidine kinase [bacterium]